MEVKPYYKIGIFLVLIIILKSTSTVSAGNPLQKVKGYIMRSSKTLQSNDVDKLLNLVLHEGDLIKMAAYSKLKTLYKNAKSPEKKLPIAIALLRSTIELIQYYGLVNKQPKVLKTLYDGWTYFNQCKNLSLNLKLKQDKCFNLNVMMLGTFTYSYTIKLNSQVQKWIFKVFNDTNQTSQMEPESKFVITRFMCETQYILHNKNRLIKYILNIYTKSTMVQNMKDTKSCLSSLEHIEDLSQSLNTPLAYDFHYVYAKAYEAADNIKMAIKYFKLAREVEVVDTKTRTMNQNIQKHIENLYIKYPDKV